jgi:hypothetical protein
MKLHRAFAVLAVWTSVVANSQAADFVGIYATRDSPKQRIEFLADGTYYQAGYDSAPGTYRRKEGRVVCVDKQGDRQEFLVLGKNLIDENQQVWSRVTAAAPIPWKNLSPLTVAVVDNETRQPVTDFSYTYTISTAAEKYDPVIVRPIEVHSDEGAFLLLAPSSCQIDLRIERGSVIGGANVLHHCDVTTENVLRRIEVPVEVGTDMRGAVVDSRTKRPVEGALVSPIVFTVPLFRPDRNRGVKTDALGQFTLRGISAGLGINVWHPDYLEFNQHGFQGVAGGRIELNSGETIAGVIKDRSGHPIPDVEVSDGAGKSVRTLEDGSFTLRSPSVWGENQTYNLSFRKEGFLDKDLSQKPPVRSPLSIVLDSPPRLAGCVLDPAGHPVAQFTVKAGPGREPEEWCCSTQTVSDSGGRFSLGIRTDRSTADDSKVWVGVKAPGLAQWETAIDGWQGTTSITVRLKAGVTVTGSVTNALGRGPMVAKLLPCRQQKEDSAREISARQELGRRETPLDSRGCYRFAHVSPGSYRLAVAGPGLSPISTAIEVRDVDIAVGPLSVAGTGTLVGQVYDADQKGRPWAFADGNVAFQDSSGNSNAEEFGHLKRIEFKTDEGGRFKLNNVPIGLVSVNIPYYMGDVGGAYSRVARISEGKITEVRFFGTSETWNLTCQFIIGDGSPAQFSSGTGTGAKRKVENVTTRPAMFRVDLVPKQELLSFCAPEWHELDARQQIVLRDVHPGRYHVVVGDWLMSIGFRGALYERDIEVQPERTALKVPLGAGSITGAVQWSRQFRYMIHVLAVGKEHHAIHHARCDDRGNFCVRYLPPDEYVLYAHDFDAGWCKLPGVALDNKSVDVGSHKLGLGGTIAGAVPPRLANDRSVTIAAIDSLGIVIKNSEWRENPGRGFQFSGLWPGKWMIELKQGDQVLSAKPVVLRGTESVSCDLIEPN